LVGVVGREEKSRHFRKGRKRKKGHIPIPFEGREGEPSWCLRSRKKRREGRRWTLGRRRRRIHFSSKGLMNRQPLGKRGCG